MGAISFWLSFRGLERAFLAGNASLFDVEYLEDAKYALGSIIQLKMSNYYTTAVSGGAAAWQSIVSEPRRVPAALRCSRCGYWHVIRLDRRGRTEEFARFGNVYQGAWQTSWFSLFSPLLKEKAGFRNRLVCQHCHAESEPGIRLCYIPVPR